MTDLKEIELIKNAKNKMQEYINALSELEKYQLSIRKGGKNEEEKSSIQRQTNIPKNSTDNACY